MAIKVENYATSKAPANLELLVNQVFESLPREHTYGINRVVIVDAIKDPRLAMAATSKGAGRVAASKQLNNVDFAAQPILYHPKTPANQAFVELALPFFTAQKENFFKRFAARTNFKANIVGALLACIGQHYYLSFSHGARKSNPTTYEASVRAYVEKHFALWREKNAGRRAKFFKPFQPYIERLDKWMRKKMLQVQQDKAKRAKK